MPPNASPGASFSFSSSIPCERVGWLRFCGQVFKSIFVPRIRILSRRDYRTQPGVLTPGTDKKGTRPEGGGREAFSALDAERDPQSISAAPSGRGPIVNVSWG